MPPVVSSADLTFAATRPYTGERSAVKSFNAYTLVFSLWQFPRCRVAAATDQRSATSYSLTVTCKLHELSFAECQHNYYAGTRRTKVPIGVSFTAPAPPTSRDYRKPAKLCYADNLMRLS